MAEIEKELRHYLEGAVEPRAALEWSRETRAAMVDLKFSTNRRSTKVSASTAPRSAGGRESLRATCS